jgi:outer membrane protein OmpA-like peptidoglycan-associated protein
MRSSLLTFGFAAAVAALSFSGCATKKYVRTQTAPLVDHADQLDQKASDNARRIHDVDQNAQDGIGRAQGAADAASQSAQQASKAAGAAQGAADTAVHRADSLASAIKDLDNYKPAGEAAVTFGFNKAVLTAEDRAELDEFAAKLPSAKGYILEVTGSTDSTGSADYNYQLSQRRADAVVQYLATRHAIPTYRFYLIGIGKERAVASNATAAGRKQNRRVQIHILVNQGLASPSGVSSKSSGKLKSKGGRVLC